MNCPHCGNPISPANRFCPNCGVDLGVTETIISQALPPIQPPPPSPAYEPPFAPPTYPTAPSPEGKKGSRNTMLIVAVVLILLCCCCLMAILATYMLFGEDILSEISLALSLV
jgi:predicted nucleic acid-binding Zn ribbon protein